MVTPWSTDDVGRRWGGSSVPGVTAAWVGGGLTFWFIGKSCTQGICAVTALVPILSWKSVGLEFLLEDGMWGYG